jgi:hypothetical protein
VAKTQHVVFLLLVESQASEFYVPRFRNTCQFHLPAYTAYEDGTERSETSAHKIQTPGIRPKERIQHSEEHGESLNQEQSSVLSQRETIPTSKRIFCRTITQWWVYKWTLFHTAFVTAT